MKFDSSKSGATLLSIGFKVEKKLCQNIPSISSRFRWCAIDQNGLIYLYLNKPFARIRCNHWDIRNILAPPCRQVDPIVFTYDQIQYIKANWTKCIFTLGEIQL